MEQPKAGLYLLSLLSVLSLLISHYIEWYTPAFRFAPDICCGVSLPCPVQTPSCFDVYLQTWPMLWSATWLRIAALKIIYSGVRVTKASSQETTKTGEYFKQVFPTQKKTTDLTLFSAFHDFSPYTQAPFTFFILPLSSEFKVTSLRDSRSHSTNDGTGCKHAEFLRIKEPPKVSWPQTSLSFFRAYTTTIW